MSVPLPVHRVLRSLAEIRLGRSMSRVAGVMLFLLTSPGWADGPTAPTGRWEGGGRACTGKLDITRQTLAWQASFSKCPAVSYKIEPLEKQGAAERTLFVLARRPTGCLFSVVELRQFRREAAAPTWEAVGYPDRGAWQKDDKAQALACPLVKIR